MGHLGEALRRERKRRGELQRDVALRFGVSQPSYHQWESGTSVPADERRQKIADYLGITVQEVWELIHAADDAPGSVEAMQAEIAALRKEVATLRAAVGDQESHADRA